jgi:plasmid stability protein
MKATEAEYSEILVRNIEESLKERLCSRIRLNRRSMKEEAREIFRSALEEETAPMGGLGTEMANLFRGIGLKPGAEIKELRGYTLEIPTFEPGFSAEPKAEPESMRISV